MEPTRLVYEAWKRTEKIIQNTKDAKGNEIVREVEFYDPYDVKHMEKIDSRCFLCGETIQEGIATKHVFSDVFTDWNRSRYPIGTHVCPACSFTILTNPKNRTSLRNFSFVAEEKLHLPNRVEMRQFLVEPPEPPFLIVLAVSQKKHLAFKGTVSYNREIYTVMLEETEVIINRKEFTRLLAIVERFLFAFTKTEVQTGQYNQQRVLKFGIDRWEWFEEQVKPYRGTELLNVVMFVAQKVEREEDVLCFMGLGQKTKTPPQPHLSFMPSIEAETNDVDQADQICGDKLNDSQKQVQSEQIQLELF
ncbi:hypothetical protein HNR63_001082 [Anoxybacillus kamchatkensis]|uniref:hypothetical protein n=1 Tax=Anoxybacillus ayderensis TaxID=265546 RepID=UPI0015EB7C49|nr:hypothetical protein [Anoxybacillus ayderensis]MBA2878028.1 hypothetical protein [Anoxybacillus ayderensis]